MRHLLLVLVLFPLFASCETPLARIDVHSDGAIDATNNLQSYAVVGEGTGYVRLTPATEPWIPIWSLDFDRGIVLLGYFRDNDGPSWKGDRHAPIPFEFATIARENWSAIRIGKLGLVFDAAPSPPGE